MAVFLTTTLLQLMLNPMQSFYGIIPDLLLQMIMGGVVGVVAGKGVAWIINRLKLEFEGLYTVLSLAVVLIIYTTSQALKGNGFLSVYIAGVVLGNESFVFKKSLILLHDGISWLMQSLMFLTLGLLLYPSKVFEVATPGLLIASFLIIIARPLSVFISLSFSEFNFREKALIAWVGLRGAVPVVLATYPLVAGIERAELIFNLIFFVALLSLVMQGTSVKFIAKILGLLAPGPVKPDFQVEYSSVASTANNMFHVKVPAKSAVAEKTIVDLKLPQDLLIVLIERAGEVIIPRGSTQIEEQDKLLVVAQKESLRELKAKIQPANEKPVGSA
jgi:potassium/hydrogen antiporter